MGGRWQYQGKVEPLEQTLYQNPIDQRLRWLGQQVDQLFAQKAQQAFFGVRVVEPTLGVYPPGMPWLDTTHDSIPAPAQRRSHLTGGPYFTDPQAVFSELITPDKWWKQNADPVLGKQWPKPWQGDMAGQPLEPSAFLTPPAVSWYRQPSEPVRGNPRTQDYQRYFAHPSVETTLDTGLPHIGWFVPASEPVRSIPPGSSRLIGAQVGVIEPTNFLSPPTLVWWQQPSEPVRDQLPRVRGIGLSLLNEPQSDMTAETVTMDKWFRRTEEPVRGARFAEPWLARVEKPLEQSLYLVSGISPDRWWRQPSEPVRQVPAALQATWFATEPEPSLYLTPAHIGWWVQPSEPIRVQLPRVPGLGFSALQLDPYQEVPTPALAWFSQASEPVRTALPRVPANGTTYVGPHAEPTLYVPLTHIGWFQQASEPVKLPPARNVILERPAFVMPLEPTQLSVGLFTDWYRPPVSIDRVRALWPQGGQESHVDPTDNAATPLSWWTQATEPQQRQLPRVHPNGIVYVGPLEQTLYATLTHIAWWTQASEPVRTQLPRVPGLASGYLGTLEPSLYVLPPALSWWQQASEPVRTQLPRVAPGPYFVQPGDPVSDLNLGSFAQWFRQASEPVLKQLPRAAEFTPFVFGGNPLVTGDLFTTGDIWYAIPPDTSEGSVWLVTDRGTIWYATRIKP